MPDLDRPPLDADALTRVLVHPGGLWRRIDVLPETGSTNADVAHAARRGEPEGLVVVAERQLAGRGRRDRQWVSPPRAGLTLSMLLRPGTAPHTWSWLPLMAGVALCEAVGSGAVLKWPNDLLIGDAKCAGILAEVAGDAVVLGVGLNVTTRADELPPATSGPPPTSLLLAGAETTDRAALLGALLGGFERWYVDWRAAAGEARPVRLGDSYRKMCATIGRRVTIHLPSGDQLTGDAVTVDGAGQLVIRTDDGERRISAGDVLHVR